MNERLESKESHPPDQPPSNFALTTKVTSPNLITKSVGAVIIIDIKALLEVAVANGELILGAKARVDTDVLSLPGGEPALQTACVAIVPSTGAASVPGCGVFVVPNDFAGVAAG